MKKFTWKSILLFLVFISSMGGAGTALAWQYSQGYTLNTVNGGSNGKPWSPYTGSLRADVWSSGTKRQTGPIGDTVSWNPAALDYIRTNGQWVSITFHSFDINNGCSSFSALDMASTNLPAPQVNKYWRSPCWPLTVQYTEVRIQSTNASLMSPYAAYYGQSFYEDNNATTMRQKISVDTYYGGQQNWHQTYCINAGAYLAGVC